MGVSYCATSKYQIYRLWNFSRALYCFFASILIIGKSFPSFLPSFFRRVGWVQHSHHASTSPSSTLLLLVACDLFREHLYSSRLGPTFSTAAVCTNLWHGCRGKRFRFVGMHHHQSMLLAALCCQHRRVLVSIDVV